MEAAATRTGELLARVGGRSYLLGERVGHDVCLPPNPAKLEIVAENKLGDESFASPAICQGRIYIRTAVGSRAQRQEYLYCLGMC